MIRPLTFTLAALAVLAIPGTAGANRNEADADCDGMTFSMPATEDGTTITITRNGTTVYSVRNDVFGRGYELSFPSPDRTVAQAWRVTVAGFNGTTVWSETVAPCVTPTSTTQPVSTSSTTTTPSPSTSSVDTVPGTTMPPSSSVPGTTTVITTPRPTTTSVPPVWVLPETGQDMTVPVMFGALAVATGVALLVVRRKGGAE